MIQPTRGYSLSNPNLFHETPLIPCPFYYLSHLFLERTQPRTRILNINNLNVFKQPLTKSIIWDHWYYPGHITGIIINTFIFYY